MMSLRKTYSMQKIDYLYSKLSLYYLNQSSEELIVLLDPLIASELEAKHSVPLANQDVFFHDGLHSAQGK